MKNNNTNAPILSIRNLSLGYKNKTIYKDITVDAYSGEVIALLGANGKGKSTLLRTIAGIQDIYTPKNTPGHIDFQGSVNDISYLPSRMDRTPNLSLFDLVAMNTYHRTNWLGSINENETTKIHKALEMVGLTGYENRDSSELSDGEFHRALIAGALVKDSSLILLDEPTAFLDIINKAAIMDLLFKIAHTDNKTIILSTHDLDLATTKCDRIWLLARDNFWQTTIQDPNTLRHEIISRF